MGSRCMVQKKEIRIERIAMRIVNLFVSSCGLALLILFFGYEETAKFTREEVVQAVSCIFLAEITLSVLCDVARYIFTRDDVFSERIVETVPVRERYCFHGIRDKKIRTVHMAGCAVMAYINNAENLELDLKRGFVRTEWNTLKKGFDEADVMMKYAGEAAEQLVLGTGCMEGMQADFNRASALLKKSGALNRIMRATDSFPVSEEIDAYVLAGEMCLRKEVKEALRPYKEVILCFSELLALKKKMDAETVREKLNELFLEIETEID